MIKSKSEMPKSGKVEIDLTGPDGNAFVLLGIAKQMAENLGKDYAPIINRMKSGNYENLLNVMEEEFGDFVIMYR